MSSYFTALSGRGISAFVAAEAQRLIDTGACDMKKDVYGDNIDAYDGETQVGNSTDFEDMLRPLPNWETMSLEEIQRTVVYHKRQGIAGVERLFPMTKDGEKAVIVDGWVLNGIVIKDSAKDGSSIGRNRWGNDEPEHSLINQQAKAAEHLYAWGINMTQLDKDIVILKAGMDSTNVHPIQDAKDFVEIYIMRRQEKIVASRKPVFRMLAMNFGNVKAKAIMKEIMAEIEKGVVEALSYTLDPEQSTLYVCQNSEELFNMRKGIVNNLVKTGEYVEGYLGRKQWVNLDENIPSAMRTVNHYLREIGGKLDKSAWILFNKMVQQYFWGWLNGALNGELNEAVAGTIERYVRTNLQMEALTVWAEDQHIDTNALKSKTEAKDVFVKEDADYIWCSRETGEMDLPKNSLGKLGNEGYASEE
jgi:peroxiredoxin family protein